MRIENLSLRRVLWPWALIWVALGVPVSALGQEVALSVSPAEASMDSPVVWRIQEAEPGAEVTVHALANDGVVNWQSEARFIARADGSIDPARDGPISGAYADVWPMGMVWSMMPDDQTSSRFNAHKDYRLSLSAHIDGEVVANAEIKRESPRDEGRLIVSDIDRDGVVGRMWRPRTEGDFPAILYIGGSGGGLNDAEAAQLAANGFIVLDLLYFGKGFGDEGTVSLPAYLVRVPIEYFGNAAKWLAEQEGVTGGSVGVYGHSRGTEAAILLAAHYSAIIEAVVVRSPSAVAWMGPGRAGFRKSAWTWQGRQVPFLNTRLRDGLSWLRKISRGERAIITRPMFEKPLSNKRWLRKGLLPVTQMRAPLLMISGKDDQQWPSAMMAGLLEQALEQADYPYAFRHLSFADAGHRPGVPYSPLPIEARQTFANGGTPRGNAQAGVQGLFEVRAFFAKYLGRDGAP